MDGMDVVQPNPPGVNAIENQKQQPTLRRNNRSSIRIFGKVTADHPALKDEDPELQEIVLEEIERTDTNNDGELDRDEFVVAMKNTAKRSRASALKEQKLESKLQKAGKAIAGLSVLSILVVIAGCIALFFALANGNSQVTSTIESSTESVLDSQATQVSVDADGTPHLVDRAGTDVSVQASGVVADARSRVLTDGTEVACVPLSAVARAVHGLSSSTEASIVSRDGEGVVRDILPLSGAFHDGGNEISFDGGKVVVRLDSNVCDVLDEGDEGEGEGVEDAARPEDSTEGGSDEASGDPFQRRLRRPARTAKTDRNLTSSRADATTKTDRALTASRADVLRRNREKYVSFLGAVHQGQRRLQDTLSVPATGSSYSTATCNSSLDQFKRNVFRVPILAVTPANILDDSSTPQARALRWIANNDQFDPPLIPGIHDARIIQRYILVALYYAVNGNGNSNLSDWLTSQSECDSEDWTGVLCASDAGGSSVTAIRLSEKGLTGPGLIPELGHLSSLRTVDFEDNNLQGTIPPELGGLSDLRNLRLSINSLTGPIPTQLGSLSVLERLFLNHNELSYGIPTELGSLGGLSECFDVCHESYVLILTPSCRLSIEELSVLNNKLTGEIPAELGDLSSLQEANFRRNELSGQMPAEICSLKSGNRDFNILRADCSGNPTKVLCYRPCCTDNACPAQPTSSPTVRRGGSA